MTSSSENISKELGIFMVSHHGSISQTLRMPWSQVTETSLKC